MQDEQLIRRAAAGDSDAFEQLLLANQKQVYHLCLRMSGNPDDANDLAQEAFIKAWRGLSQYQFGSEFSTWLYRLTRNVCIDFLRRQKRQAAVSLVLSDEEEEDREFQVPDPAPQPEDVALSSETREELQRAMDALPADYREILQLRVVEDLPYERIAELLDIKLGTVKSRLARARIQLRNNLVNGNQTELRASNKQMKEVGRDDV